jgi:hypothetical protein
MAIKLSNLTFTEQDDIVPVSGVERIINTGIANTFAGNDIITRTGYPDTGFGRTKSTVKYDMLNTGDGNDIITGTGGRYYIIVNYDVSLSSF